MKVADTELSASASQLKRVTSPGLMRKAVQRSGYKVRRFHSWGFSVLGTELLRV